MTASSSRLILASVTENRVKEVSNFHVSKYQTIQMSLTAI